MDVMQALLARRSVRAYVEGSGVTQDQINQLLQAAMSVATAANKQPWEFIVVNTPQSVASLKEILPYGKYNAPCAIVACGNLDKAIMGWGEPTGNDFWVQDLSAAMQAMMTQAVALGLGSVWIGVHPIKERVELLQDHLHMPEHIIPLGVLLLGAPDPEKISPPRTQYNEEVVFYEEYGKK